MTTPSPPPPPAFSRSRYPERVGGFKLLDLLGEGGMGAVFVGEPDGGGPRVAVKLIRPELAGDETVRARFRREAWAQAQVAHPHIVPILQIDESGGIPFIAMPLLRGQTLDARLAAEPVPPLALTLRVGWEVADGLAAAYAARQLIHRDIKPSNVWLEADAGGRFRRALILDFGLARPESGNTYLLTAGGAMIGTPGYMSPERVNGEAVDHRADLFSMGVMLYLMATGKQPFAAPTAMSALAKVLTYDPPPARNLNPAVPGRLSDLIARLLEKDQNDRPESATEVADELRTVARLLGVSTRPFKLAEPEPPPPTGAVKGDTTEWPLTVVPPPPAPPPAPVAAASDSEVMLEVGGQAAPDFTPPWLTDQLYPDSEPTKPDLRPEPKPEPPPPPPSRWRYLVVLVLVAVAAGVVAVAILRPKGGGVRPHSAPTKQKDDPPPPPPPLPPAPTLDRLDPTLVRADERWPGIPPEVVAVVGSRVRQHFGGVGLILTDPLDRWVATTDANGKAGRVRLWDPHDLTPVGQELAWDGGPAKGLAVSPDGRRLAALDTAGQVYVFDITRPTAIKELTHRIPVRAVQAAFLAGGRLAIATADGRLAAWDVAAEPREVRRVSVPGGPVAGELKLTAAPAGWRVAVWSDRDAARVIDLEPTPPALVASLGPADQVVFADAETVYTLDRTGGDTRVQPWRLGVVPKMPAVVASVPETSFARLTVSPAGEVAVSVSTPGAAKVLRFVPAADARAGRPLRPSRLRDADDQAVPLAYGRRDPFTLYTGGLVLRAWDVTRPEPAEIDEFDPKKRVTVAVLGGGFLIAAHADGKLRRWDLTGLAPPDDTPGVPAGGGAEVVTLAATADAKTVVHPADTTDKPGVRVHPFGDPSGEPVWLPTRDRVNDVSVSADGRVVVAAAGRGLTVWERGPDGYAERVTEPTGVEWVWCAVSPDGKWVAGWEQSFGLRVFAAGDFTKVDEVVGPPGARGKPVFSADGTWLAVIGEQMSRPQLRRLTDGKWVEFPFPAGATGQTIHAATFLPLPRGALVMCADRPDGRGYQLDISDPASGPARPPVPLPGRARTLSAAADGRHVAAVLDNGTVVVVRLFSR